MVIAAELHLKHDFNKDNIEEICVLQNMKNMMIATKNLIDLTGIEEAHQNMKDG